MSAVLNRRNFLETSAAGAVASGAVSASGPFGAHDRPNLLFILTDQWRFSAFGHSSDEIVRTPHVDQMAQDGALFRRAYAANPVCTPNRSCLLTGRYSHQTGMIRNDLMLPPAEKCWPQVFADAGYRTHYIGKWHVDGVEKPGYVPPGWRRRGFQTFQGFNRGHIYHRPWGFDDDGSELVPADVAADPDYYEPAFQTDLAIDFMSQQAAQPFVCCVSLGPPHTPFRPPRKFDRYTVDELRLRPNVPENHDQRARKDLAGYYGLCESLDHEVGRMIAHLRTAGLLDRTLVVFTSDHGELAGSHGKYRKGEPEEESLHVPLLMQMPGRIPSGTTVDGLINSIDLMPTILSICGLESPESCSGIDVSRNVLDAATDSVQSAVYCEGKLTGKPRRTGKKSSDGAWRTIVTDRYKLTVRGGERSVSHLFDLENDPFETQNLAKSARHQSLVGELLDQLLEFRDASEDSWPEVPRQAKPFYDA